MMALARLEFHDALAEVARHEAGHGVAVWHLAKSGFHRRKLPPPAVTRLLIKPDGSGICECDRICVYFEHGRPVDPSTMPGELRHQFGGWGSRELVADLIMFMTGPLAAAPDVSATFADFFDALPDHRDRQSIEERMAWLYDARWIECAFRLARRIARERRRHIEAVAAELLAHGCLEGEAFAAVCEAVEAEAAWP